MIKSIITILSLLILLSACDEIKSSTETERGKQEQMSLQSVQAVGMPAITNFAEKRMMKDILELRDKSVPTITYISDMNGKMHKLCDSIGFGLPYSTQYTSPMKLDGNSQSYTTVPQADPNGLYSPASSDGTWVQCVNPKTKEASVIYVEPRIIVSPFELD